MWPKPAGRARTDRRAASPTCQYPGRPACQYPGRPACARVRACVCVRECVRVRAARLDGVDGGPEVLGSIGHTVTRDLQTKEGLDRVCVLILPRTVPLLNVV